MTKNDNKTESPFYIGQLVVRKSKPEKGLNIVLEISPVTWSECWSVTYLIQRTGRRDTILSRWLLPVEKKQ